jgi:hypothetical protein
MNQAGEQFVNDFTLVVDNDQEEYNIAIERADDHETVASFATELREEWEGFVDEVADLVGEQHGKDSPAQLLIRQMLGGWGDDEFFAIAKHYKERN